MEKTKKVRFDFYDARCSVSPAFDRHAQKVAEKVRKYQDGKTRYQKSQYRKFAGELESITQQRLAARTGYWNIAALVTYACQEGVQITYPLPSGDMLEIDKSTYYHEDENLVAFQVTTLRSHDIPAKKKPGRDRESLGLEDDEYIGEFTQVIYDRRFHTVAIQATKHGASYKAVEALLNEIDRKMRETRIEIGSFDPLINPDEIDRINASGRYKKFTVKCSEASHQLGVMPDHFAGAQRYLNADVTSWSMELTIAFTGADREQSLSPMQIQQAVQSFQAIQNDPTIDPRVKEQYGIDVTYYDERTEKFETVDLLIPKLHFFVYVRMEARKVIESQYMYDLVTEAYRGCEGRLSDIMRHRVQGENG